MSSYNIPKGLVVAVNQISLVIDRLRSLVDTFNSDDAEFECEIRLGENDGGTFKPGVDKSFFYKTLKMLSQYSDWTKVVDWEETHDYFFKNDNNEDLRCSVSFNDNVIPSTIKKEKLHTTTLIRADCEDDVYDLRVTLSSEKKVASVPAIVRPSLVRIKQRKSFVIDKNWRYDFTKVWTANSRQQVEGLKKLDEPSSFEIEVEILHPRDLLRRKGNTNEMVAFSLLLKILSVCDNVEKLEYV